MVTRPVLRERVVRVLVGAASFLAAYVFWRLSGMVSTVPVRLSEALGALPAQIAAAVLLAAAAMFLWLEGTERTAAGYGAPDRRLTRILASGGLFLLCAGILVSGALRVERIVELTEGQETEPAPAAAPKRSGSFLPHPDGLGFGLAHVRSVKVPGTGLTADVTAHIVITAPVELAGRTVIARKLVPAILGGTIVRTGRTGYSPRYRITTSAGEVLDEAYVLMRLTPPGTEDFFRVRELAHTFFLRYHPAAGGAAPAAGARSSPPVAPFLFRAARNLDLITPTQPLRMGEQVQVDAFRISFEDVRPWVEIRIVRDPGLYLVLPGLVLLGMAALAAVLPAAHRGRGADGLA